jgi:membrane protease YdiL (CAAX protease family)
LSTPDPGHPRFSPLVTGLALIVVLASVALHGLLLYGTPRLGDVGTAERALPQIVTRTMDLRAALAQAPRPEQRLYELLAGDVQRDLAEAIRWYEELAQESADPVVLAQLLILEGEAGRPDRLREHAATWQGPEWLRQVIRRAYLDPSETAADDAAFQPEQAALLLEGWFHDQLALRWGQQAGAPELVRASQESLARRARPLLWRVRALAAVELIVLALGLLALVVILARRQRPQLLRVAAAPLPPPWRGRAGLAVLVRGAALGAPLTFALGLLLLVLEQRHPVARLFGWPVYVLMFLPAIVLAWFRLLRPRGLSVTQAFGLRVAPGGVPRLVLVALGLLGLGALADLLIGLSAEGLRLGSHWSEWFSEDLVWGSGPTMAVALVELLILAPILEELVFRGLLYGTLRRGLGATGAALLSAAAFAIGHGYGAAGLASVFTAGVIYAWAYEETGSVLPGMVAHSASNLMSALAVAGLLRA